MKQTSGARPARTGPRAPAFRRSPRVSSTRVAVCSLAFALAASAGATAASAQPAPATAKAAGASTSASAATAEVQGVVLAIEQDELVLDLGSQSGATENLIAELWRPLRVKHPVTGKVLTDRFKIGQVQLGQVRPTMSLAKASGTLARPAAAGDLVIFTRVVPASAPAASAASAAPSAPAPSRPSAPGAPEARGPATPYDDPAPAGAPEAAPAAAPADVDAKAVTEMFEGLRGQPVHLRIARYEAFLRAHPDSRFTQVLHEESQALRALLPNARRGHAPVAPAVPTLVSAPARVDAVSGHPVRIAVELDGEVRGAVLQVRRKGDTLFTPVAMAPAGARYFAATIPSERVTDRDLEYFVEAVGDGATLAVLGDPASPERVRVQTSPQVKPPPTGNGSVTVLTDFADYNRLRGNDYAWQTEGTFAMRYKDLGIRAVRMGFGVYRGVSGSVAELDADDLALRRDPREVGLTYGYLEGEIGIHRLFSLIGRAAVGLLDDGVSGGGQLLARIGNDRGTNLVLGGEVLGGVGLRSIVQLELNTFERFPIVLRSEVTNQPAGFAPSETQLRPRDVLPIAEGQSEVAGRGIVQIGFRVTPELVLAVRGSFQGRNINHAGPGVGGSVGYTW